MANPFAIVIDDAIFLSDYSVFLLIILLMTNLAYNSALSSFHSEKIFSSINYFVFCSSSF